MSHGAVLYEGPSMITGEPIFAVITKLGDSRTLNRKLGPNTAQVYILDQNFRPHQARDLGISDNVCGNCPIEDLCYVNLKFVNRVWECYQRGGYDGDLPWAAERIRKKGLLTRLATFGDPSAIPIEKVHWFADHSLPVIGYTHHWEKPWTDPGLKRFISASCETQEDVRTARILGWRTFRARRAEEPLMDGEFACPADETHWSAKRTTCDECRMCDGTWDGDSRSSASIIYHGDRARKQLRISV